MVKTLGFDCVRVTWVRFPAGPLAFLPLEKGMIDPRASFGREILPDGSDVRPIRLTLLTPAICIQYVQRVWLQRSGSYLVLTIREVVLRFDWIQLRIDATTLT